MSAFAPPALPVRQPATQHDATHAHSRSSARSVALKQVRRGAALRPSPFLGTQQGPYFVARRTASLRLRRVAVEPADWSPVGRDSARAIHLPVPESDEAVVSEGGVGEPERPLRDEELWGTVVAVQANFYQVRLDPRPSLSGDNLSAPLEILCTRRARLKKIDQSVMVGDRVRIAGERPRPVEYAPVGGIGGGAAIEEVALPRATELDRPPVANAFQALVVISVADPPIDPDQATRFIVACEAAGLRVRLCVNKSDLVTEQQLTAWRVRIQDWGYDPLFVSAERDEDIERVVDFLREGAPPGAITVVVGPSGVGKSSILNRLVPDLNLRTGEVSGKLRRGRHTTRHVQLFELPGGAAGRGPAPLLADTPGFNRPDVTCSPEDLAAYFPEIARQVAAAGSRCAFADCLHRDEEGCVVRGDWERYPHYVSMVAEAEEREEQMRWRETAGASSERGEKRRGFKAVTAKGGRVTYEPKLDARKYRSESRKTVSQRLRVHDWGDEGDGDEGGGGPPPRQARRRAARRAAPEAAAEEAATSSEPFFGLGRPGAAAGQAGLAPGL